MVGMIAGDSSIFGWLTVVVYLTAAVACLACAWQARRIFGAAHVGKHRLVWGALAFGLLFLGVNKQLDLQSWFTAVVKTVAYEQGWYAAGQRAQVFFIVGLIVASVTVAAGAAWTLRRVWRHYWLLLLGFLFLARFIIVRAATFYGVALPELSRFTGGVRVTGLLEMAGAALIAVAAALNLRRAKLP